MASLIWVVPELQEDGLHEVTLEILGEGRRLATQPECEVAAVLIGRKIAKWADELIHWGADKVYLVEHEMLEHYTTDGYTKVLADLVEQYAPDILLLGATPNGRDFGSRLAARLRTGMVSGCTGIKVNESGMLEMSQPIYEDRVYRTIVPGSAKTQIVAIRPGVAGKDKPDTSRRGVIINIIPAIVAGDIRTQVLERLKADQKTLALEEADVVVVGGRGMQTIERWHLVEDLAEVLGGCVGGTRMSLDAGWISLERLIGQTGKSISPKLCIEAGVSGTVQHTAGIRDARSVMAINKDRYAPIFKVADIGVVADLHDFIPALIAHLGKLRDEASTVKEE
jgi:electron transfer flavoprotein alpha subunit